MPLIFTHTLKIFVLIKYMSFLSFCQEKGADKLAKGAKSSEKKLNFNIRPKKSKNAENSLNGQSCSWPNQLDDFKFKFQILAHQIID